MMPLRGKSAGWSWSRIPTSRHCPFADASFDL